MFAVNLALAAANVGLVGAHVNRKIPTKAVPMPEVAPKTKTQMSAHEKRVVEETVAVGSKKDDEPQQKFQKRIIATEEATDPYGKDEELDVSIVDAGFSLLQDFAGIIKPPGSQAEELRQLKENLQTAKQITVHFRTKPFQVLFFDKEDLETSRGKARPLVTLTNTSPIVKNLILMIRAVAAERGSVGSYRDELQLWQSFARYPGDMIIKMLHSFDDAVVRHFSQLLQQDYGKDSQQFRMLLCDTLHEREYTEKYPQGILIYCEHTTARNALWLLKEKIVENTYQRFSEFSQSGKASNEARWLQDRQKDRISKSARGRDIRDPVSLFSGTAVRSGGGGGANPGNSSAHARVGQTLPGGIYARKR